MIPPAQLYSFKILEKVWKIQPWCCPALIRWNPANQKFEDEESKIRNCLRITFYSLVFLPHLFIYPYIFLYALWQPGVGNFAAWSMNGLICMLIAMIFVLAKTLLTNKKTITQFCNGTLSVQELLKVGLGNSTRKCDRTRSYDNGSFSKISSIRENLAGYKKECNVLETMSCIGTVYFALGPICMISCYGVLYQYFGFRFDNISIMIKSFPAIRGIMDSWEYTFCLLLYFLILSSEGCQILSFFVNFAILAVSGITYILEESRYLLKSAPSRFKDAMCIFNTLAVLWVHAKIVMDSFVLIILGFAYLAVVISASVVALGYGEIPLGFYWVAVMTLVISQVGLGLVVPRASALHHCSLQLLRDWKTASLKMRLSAKRGEVHNIKIFVKEITAVKPVSFHFGKYRKLDDEALREYFESMLCRTIDTCILLSQWKG